MIYLRAALSANRQARRNAEDGRMWIEIADSQLCLIVGCLHRARELVLTACNGMIHPEEIGSAIEELTESIANLANSRYRGRPLFGGFVSGNPVLAEDRGWVYRGDGGAITRRVADQEIIQVNVTGDVLFGFDAGKSLFRVLDDIAAQILAGDVDGLSASLDGLDGGLSRVHIGRLSLGAGRRRVEQALLRSRAEEVYICTALSGLEDTDLVTTIMDLELREAAYQAAQRALEKTLQPSLASFLR